MRKIFTLLTMCLLATAAWAQTEIVFIPGETVGNNETAQGADEMSKDGITVSTTSGGLKAREYRFAKGSVTTITSTVGNIIKIEFTCTASGTTKYGPGCFAAQDGYSYDDNIGIWEGAPATSVSFTAESNQVRASKIVVTVGDAGLAKPVINPASGTYYSQIQVSITCNTSGAKIYYTTDGNDPTTSSKQYTAPFAVNSNTTVKAISAKDGETSDVVTATYEFGTATTVNNIAEYLNAANDAVLIFNNPVYVLAQNRNYLYVKDNTGYALFFGPCGQTYTNGDAIPANFVGTRTTYNGEPELSDLSNFQAASSNSPIAPEEITADEVGHSMFAHYVKMDDVTITAVEENGRTNYVLTDAEGNTCAVYFGSMGVSVPNDLNGTFNVMGIVGSYGTEPTIYQLLPTYIKKNVPIGEGYGLDDLGNLPDDTPAVLVYDATVLGQSGQYLYLMDETGFGLAYGQCGKTYTYGDIVPAGYSGTKTTWDAEPELKDLSGFETASGNIGGIEALMDLAEPISPNQVAHPIWGHFVKLSQVTIDTQNKTFTDGYGNSCPYYDRFGVAFPQDTNLPYDVYGIVASYGKTNTVYQILPVKIVFDNKPVDVASINELYSKNQGVVGHFTTPLTTIYQNGINLYVKDAEGTYSLAYGSVAYNDFVNGDFINDAQASWTTYNNFPQLKPVAETFVKSGHGNAVEPEILPIEEVSQDMIHWYLGFENVTITPAEAANTYTMTDETGEMIVYDKFHEFDNIDPTTLNYVEGFLTVYNGQLELYPVIIEVVPIYEPEDVNHDGEVNILDINLVIDAILSGRYFGDVDGNGEINITDINRIVSRILK